MSAGDTLRKYADAFNRSDVDDLISLYATSTSYRNPFVPAPLTDPDEVRTFEAPMFAAFSDVTATLEEIIDGGDRAAARVTIRGVHTGEMPTPGGAVPATEKPIVLHLAEFVRVDADDRIVEHHRMFDSATLMTQLGLL